MKVLEEFKNKPIRHKLWLKFDMLIDTITRERRGPKQKFTKHSLQSVMVILKKTSKSFRNPRDLFLFNQLFNHCNYHTYTNTKISFTRAAWMLLTGYLLSYIISLSADMVQQNRLLKYIWKICWDNTGYVANDIFGETTGLWKFCINHIIQYTLIDSLCIR